MSEYSYGNLVRMKYRDVCEQYLDNQTRIIVINQNWLCLVMEQDKYFINKIDDRPIANNLLELSKQAPILFFAYPEDHGFGFSILHDGKTINSYYLDYMALDNCPPASSRFKNIKFDVEAFRLFECDDKQLKALADLLNTEVQEDCYTIPQKFKSILGLREMQFVSWDYVQSDDYPHDFIGEAHKQFSTQELPTGSEEILQELMKFYPKYPMQSGKISSNVNTCQAINVGDDVKHKSFGQGKIIKTTPMANDILVEIEFHDVGTKKVMLNHANLEKL